jgi:hypothetical protein
MLNWWRRRSIPSQGLLLVLGVIVAVGVLLRVLVTVTGGPRAQGPDSSSFATSDAGLAAWAQVLEDAGHPVVRLRSSLDQVDLTLDGTLVMLDTELTVTERFALRRYLGNGGRAVIGGVDMAGSLNDVLGGAQSFPLTSDTSSTGGVDTEALRAVTDVNVTAKRVRLAEISRFSSVSPLRRIITSEAGNGVVLHGEGKLLLVSDASFLQNRLLGEEDNAAVGLGLVGPGPVMFAEFGHGYANSGGLLGGDVLPERWSWFITGLLLAFGLWVLSQARRIGPPRMAHRVLPPPRVRYVDALAASLQRVRADTASADPLPHDPVPHDPTRHDLIQHDAIQHDVIQHDLIRHDANKEPAA